MQIGSNRASKTSTPPAKNMKTSKYIIIISLLIVALLLGVILGKGILGTSRQKQAEMECEKQHQIEKQQAHESAVRIRESFKNLNETR
ncbi:MAG: hypothetical protein FJX18_05490 [Alphaproteobacteria bacterium]|nr:hypothetical protein [Alphaproteobacteria bacterium]